MESALAALKKVFQQTTLPRVKSFLRTNWGDDKYAKGSYTFAAVGSHLQDFDQIALSIGNNRVHFAGEHTN